MNQILIHLGISGMKLSNRLKRQYILYLNTGFAELRAEICKYYKKCFDLEYMQNVIVTVGGSEVDRM